MMNIGQILGETDWRQFVREANIRQGSDSKEEEKEEGN